VQKRLTLPRTYQCVLELGCLEVAEEGLWAVLEEGAGDKRARTLQVGTAPRHRSPQGTAQPARALQANTGLLAAAAWQKRARWRGGRAAA
jgi:hypothetical protein